MHKKEKIPGPVVEIDVEQARQNIRHMLAKARNSKAILRPHFKTHQSYAVAEWFREEGGDRCTVSSPAMAEYFAEGGWQDILIAFPAQAGAIDHYNKLSEHCHLGLISDSPTVIAQLDKELENSVDFWIEIDTGYSRSGIRWDKTDGLHELSSQIEACTRLRFRGLLCHAGDSYACRGNDEINAVYDQATQRAQIAMNVVESHLGRKVELSYGDTPTCSVRNHFTSIDELRPGNFVFYDLMQQIIGACKFEDIALSLACPIVGVYTERNEVVIHGGAVHFSKEKGCDGSYGKVFTRDEHGGVQVLEQVKVLSLSQEHGVISGPKSWVETLTEGDVVRVFPVHSCLTMDCMLNRKNSLRYLDHS